MTVRVAEREVLFFSFFVVLLDLQHYIVKLNSQAKKK